jgi:hypothetical protein
MASAADLLPPRRRAPALAAGLLCAMAALPATAQMYVCTTAAGRTVSGDVPPPECRDREMRVLNRDGSLQTVMPAPLSAEQRQARDDEKRAQERRAEEERKQAHRDQALLETYGSVEEVEGARRRALSAQQTIVERSDQRLRQYASARKRLDDEAEFYAKRKIPQELQDEYDANARLAAQQEKLKGDALAEIARINLKYDNEARRLREIQEQTRLEQERRASDERRFSQ